MSEDLPIVAVGGSEAVDLLVDSDGHVMISDGDVLRIADTVVSLLYVEQACAMDALDELKAQLFSIQCETGSTSITYEELDYMINEIQEKGRK
jgi:hypothetical protein